MTVLLVEIDVTSPAGAASTLRFSDRAIAPFPPGDATRPNVGFDARLTQAPSLQRRLFEDVSSLTPSLGVGLMTLANADLALNTYEGYAWGAVSVWLWTEGTAFSAATLILKGLCDVPQYPVDSSRPNVVQVGLYDYRAELAQPIQATVYAGTNGVGGVLYEGAADGLKGQPKPLAYGNLLNAMVPGAQVNAGVQAWQLHDGVIQGSEQIFDRGDGAGLTDDGDSSGAAFDAATPAAAHYRTDVGRGLLKTSFSPVGKVAFGLKGDASGSGYVETPGPILARILAKAGVPGGRIGASVAALASAVVVGAYAGDTINGDAFAAPIAASASAVLIPDRSGVWQAVGFAAPKVLADVTLASADVIDMATDASAPLPVGEVRVGWGRIYSTFAGSELAPALVNTTSQERLAAEYRWAVATDATTKARRAGTWRSVDIPTALRNEADATALASALIALFALRSDGRPRRQWRVTVERATALAASLGQTVAVTYPRLGLAQNFLLIGEELLRPRRDQAVWTLWG